MEPNLANAAEQEKIREAVAFDYAVKVVVDLANAVDGGNRVTATMVLRAIKRYPLSPEEEARVLELVFADLHEFIDEGEPS